MAPAPTMPPFHGRRRRSYALATAALIGQLARPHPAAGAEVSTTFTNDFELRYLSFDPTPLVHLGGPPPKFVEQVDRFTARATAERWALHLQVDEVLFVGLPYEVDGERRTEPPPLLFECGLPKCITSPFGERFYLNPEKVGLTYRASDVSAAAGDFYAAFGNGAALNVNRNVDIDIDTSIQGGRVTATPGPWEVTALAGMLNRQQVFADNQNVGMLHGDLRHLVGGVRVQRHELGPAAVGLHGVTYDFVDTYGFGVFDELGSPLDAAIGGATLELFGLGGVDLQLEGDVVGFPAQGDSLVLPAEASRVGHALYGSASFAAGATIWQLDVKRYQGLNRVNAAVVGEQYQVVVPPTLEYERAINFNTAAAVGSNDIWGGRARVDLALGQVTPYLSLAAFRDTDLENAAQHAPAPETIGTVLGGVEALLDDVTVLTNALGRVERRDRDNGQDVQLYADVDVQFPLVGESHGEVIVFGQRFLGGPERRVFEVGEDHDWTEASIALTVAPTHAVGATGYLDYTTNPFAGLGGNLGPTNFGAVEVFAKPASAWTVKVFHGGYAAGIRCSGGQCRTVPAFTGTRFAVTGTF